MDIFRASTKRSNIEIYRFVYTPVKANMYFILSKNEAIIIDPHESSEGYEFLSNNGVDNIKILLTHEHFDCITIPYLKSLKNEMLIMPGHGAPLL